MVDEFDQRACLQAFDDFRRSWQVPVATFVVGRGKVGAFVLAREPSMRFANGCFERVLHLRIGVEGLALLAADGFELIDHGLVAGERGLDLHDAVERLEVAPVPGNVGIKHLTAGTKSAARTSMKYSSTAYVQLAATIDGHRTRTGLAEHTLQAGTSCDLVAEKRFNVAATVYNT